MRATSTRAPFAASQCAAGGQTIQIEAAIHGHAGEFAIAYVSGLVFGAPPIVVPLAAPILMGQLQLGHLEMTPLPLTVDPSAIGVVFTIGHARWDTSNNLIEHELQSCSFQQAEKTNTTVELDDKDKSEEPSDVEVGAISNPKRLKVTNDGPTRVLIQEWVPDGNGGGSWADRDTVGKGETKRRGPASGAGDKNYRVKLRDTSATGEKATITYNIE